MKDSIGQDPFALILLNSKTREELAALGRTPGPLFDQYKLYVEMADRISSRRLTANSFFLAINSAIITLGGYTTLRLGELAPMSLAAAVSLAGITLCLLWFRILQSYRDLNTAKFTVIHEMEKLLPLSPYHAEWQAVGRGAKPSKYLPLTHLELLVPWIFAALHLGAFLAPRL